jgi:hypothetical protein
MLQGCLQSLSMPVFRYFYGRCNSLASNNKLWLGEMLSDLFHFNSFTVFDLLTLTADLNVGVTGQQGIT